MITILRDMFGSGTWGVAGNLVASAILTVPAVIVSHVRARRHREAQHADLKQHVTNSTGGPDGQADTA